MMPMVSRRVHSVVQERTIRKVVTIELMCLF